MYSPSIWKQWHTQPRLRPGWVNDRCPRHWLPASGTAPARHPLPCHGPFQIVLSTGGGVDQMPLGFVAAVVQAMARAGAWAVVAVGVVVAVLPLRPLWSPGPPKQGTPWFRSKFHWTKWSLLHCAMHPNFSISKVYHKSDLSVWLRYFLFFIH